MFVNLYIQIKMVFSNENYGIQKLNTEVLIQTSFMGKVYLLVSLALLVTFGVSVTLASSEVVSDFLYSSGFGGITMMILIFAQFGLLIALSAGISRFSTTTAISLFMLYSVLTGVTLSWIFIVYDLSAIMAAFGASVGMFAIMGLFGYFTKTDLTKIGNIAIMGLLGIIFASLINAIFSFFGMGIDSINWIITYLGVLVFLVLIAWDTQKLKNFAVHADQAPAESSKYAVMAGMSLYLDFLNLFLLVLRIFGRNR